MSSGGLELKQIHPTMDGKEKDNIAFDSSDTQKPSPHVSYIDVNNDDSNKNGLRHRPVNGSKDADVEHNRQLDADSDSIKDDDSDLGPCSRAINQFQQRVIDFYKAHETAIIRIILVLLLLLYMAYVIYSLGFVRFGDEGSIRLLVCTLFGLAILGWSLFGDSVTKFTSRTIPSSSPERKKRIQIIIRRLLYVVSLVAMVTLLIVLVAMETPDNLVSLGGLAAFIFLSWITSTNPAKVDWHPVFWGFSIQFYFAVIILRTRWGYQTFEYLGDRITEFLAYSDEGAQFVFGADFRMHFFAFAILPVIIFFSAIISVLYYVGVMQSVVRVIGRFLSFCMGTTPAESINAAGNIFVGMTEAPLMIRPFLGKMTKSELHAVMTGGFATIAGSVLGVYIGFGVPANHLLSASVMSAPAALAISKLMYPETEVPQINDDDYEKIEKGVERNLIEAASAGAASAAKICAAVLVNVIAFLSILKFVNVTLVWLGERAGVQGFTFDLICSYVLYPVSVFMGTEIGLDCRRVAKLVGMKTFTNEFIAYDAMRVMIGNRAVWKNYTTHFNASQALIEYDDLDMILVNNNSLRLKEGIMTMRSEVIATYALCGFSNIGSMGIMLGGLSAIAPHRKQDLASIVLRAMIAGNIACFFTACIAGLFYQDFDN